MPNSSTIQIIVGSVREGRMAMPVARWVADAAAKRDDFSCEIVDLKDWALPFYPFPKPPAAGGYTDPLQIRWAEQVKRADGYILITPEYNRGPSAALKNALDFVYAEWGGKPVGFVAYGGVGGARAVEVLQNTALALGMMPLGAAVHLVRPGDRREGDVFNGAEFEATSLGRLLAGVAERTTR